MSRKDKLIAVANHLLDTRTSNKMLIDSFKEILPIRSNCLSFMVLLIICCFFSIIIGFNSNTVQIMSEVVDVAMNVILTILGINFTVYSIMIVFMNDDFVEYLANNEEKCKGKEEKESSLVHRIRYFESILFLYSIGLFISFVVLVVLKVIDNNFLLLESILINNILATVLIFLYSFFVVRLVYEIKATIFNTIVLFRSYLASKIIDFIKKSGD